MGRTRAVVLGAGPAGAAAAAVLAARGWEVHVLEKRPMPLEVESLRNYTLILHERGLAACQRVGFDMTRFEGSLQGVCNNRADGTVLVQGSNEHGWQKVTRPGLARHLVQESLRLPGGDAITYHFCKVVVGLDLAQQTVTFGRCEDAASSESEVAAAEGPGSGAPPQAGPLAGATQTLGYDLLVGADGMWSQTRQALVEQVPGFTAKLDVLPLCYKRFLGVSSVRDWQVPGKRVEEPGCMVHFTEGFKGTRELPPVMGLVIRDDPGQGRPGTVLGPASDDAQYNKMSCRASSDGSYAGGALFHQAAKRAYSTLEAFQCMMEPHTFIPAPHRAAIAQKLCDSPWTASSGWVTCSQLHGPRVVLIGDAAHAVTASIGQGVNAALEDAAILATILDTVPELDNLPAAWTAARLEEVHALSFLDRSSRAFRTPGRTLQRFKYLSHLKVHGALHRLLPDRFVAPGFEALAGSNPRMLGFRELQRCIQLDFTAVICGIAGLASLSALAAVKLLQRKRTA